MKTITHNLPRGISMLTVAQWCREHATPVLIVFPRPTVIRPQEYSQEYSDPVPEYVRVTGRSIIRRLAINNNRPASGSWHMYAIVRDQDFDLFRLRF
jgi:hypothetical protein